MALGNYDHVPEDAYSNVKNAFSIWWVVLIYVICNLGLSMHLYHGAFSMLQSIGFNHPRYNARLKLIARGLAFLVTAGNVFLPLTVFLGLVPHRAALERGALQSQIGEPGQPPEVQSDRGGLRPRRRRGRRHAR